MSAFLWIREFQVIGMNIIQEKAFWAAYISFRLGFQAHAIDHRAYVVRNTGDCLFEIESC